MRLVSLDPEGVVRLLSAILWELPSLPAAACRDRPGLFDARLPDETPVQRAQRLESAVAVCRGCSEMAVCEQLPLPPRGTRWACRLAAYSTLPADSGEIVMPTGAPRSDCWPNGEPGRGPRPRHNLGRLSISLDLQEHRQDQGHLICRWQPIDGESPAQLRSLGLYLAVLVVEADWSLQAD